MSSILTGSTILPHSSWLAATPALLSLLRAIIALLPRTAGRGIAIGQSRIPAVRRVVLRWFFTHAPMLAARI